MALVALAVAQGASALPVSVWHPVAPETQIYGISSFFTAFVTVVNQCQESCQRCVVTAVTATLLIVHCFY